MNEPNKEQRCLGHCCKRFALKESYEELQAEYAQWKLDPSIEKTRDIEKIASMVIPISKSRNGLETVYTCKNLKPNGDCGIYDDRPQMCRDFPDESGCHFLRCKSSSSAYYKMPVFKKILTRYRWLRSLSTRNSKKGQRSSNQ